MAKAKKFGAFSGVFTPSILTILGVIMYMRLGWVVGEAGLIATIGIILVAHIISVTTGLSISSIATDKKIKGGGIYYMLSRTLGLPMGGAIGITLFLGTALSISLYVIGFAESFLSIPAIANFLHLQANVDGYRIVGTAVIIVLVILAFISTSLAIKSQFLILGAILLSLVSIIVGFFVHPELMPDKPLIGIASGDVSLELVFAIFFPAVTGFTAGVAMSGDLKDPKKNIPVGTILSIFVGFVIYITLAILLALFVNREDLINDTNIALRIAWVPVLVIAGIWGATLSSALGGILGGPRILQALSKDAVMPKILGKGYGNSNEPRNALIFIFLIAEGGILIGELNMIASVVTMFYLASYGFINLAYVLESWASTDFRPSFKVSRIFGIVGFVFAFVIMFQLDMLSMVAAFAIIVGIYFLLKRKQLKLEFGDVWQSVWNSVVRRGLHRLSLKMIEERNWQPNIILFSGGTENRLYLIEFGKSLVGKFGMLSNFDLVEESSAKVLFPKHKQGQRTKHDESGIFTRQQSCKDIYDGIEMIARTYGFSGIEPNTIILGWARQTKKPERFHRLLQTINDLDYNILLIDYDKRYAYGKYKQIDIWWRGEGNNGSLALTLAKFMIASSFWENAKIRLMIVNFENDKTSYIHRRADEILTAMRLEAEVKIINNQIEQKPVYDIIRMESKSADIVFVGIPEINAENETEFVQKTNVLLHEIGTVVLLKAASVFKNLSLGVNKEQEALMGVSSREFFMSKSLDINLSEHEAINVAMNNFSARIIEVYNQTYQNYLFNQRDVFVSFFEKFRIEINENLSAFQHHFSRLPADKVNRFIVNYHHLLFNKLNRLFVDFKAEHFDQLQTLMDTVVAEFDEGMKPLWKNIPETIFLSFPRDAFKQEKNDSFSFKRFKRKKLSKSKKDFIVVPFSLQKYLMDLQPIIYAKFIDTVGETGIETVGFLLKFQNFLKSLSFEFDSYRKLALDKNLTIDRIEESKQTILNQMNEEELVLGGLSQKVTTYFNNKVILEINEFIAKTEKLKSVFYFTSNKKTASELKNLQHKLPEIVNPYFSNLSLFLNVEEAENYLLQYNSLLNAELNEIMVNTNLVVSDEFLQNITVLSNSLQTMLREKKQGEVLYDKLMPEPDVLFKKMETINQTSLKRIRRILKVLPSEITVMDEVSFNNFFAQQFDEIKTVTVAFLQMIEFLTENKITNQIANNKSDLQEALTMQINQLKEHYRLFLFSFDEYAKEELEDKKSLEEFLNNQIVKILETKNNIEQDLKQYAANIIELKSEISGQTTLYGLTKFESNLKHYIHAQREQEKISLVKQKTNRIGDWVSRQAVRFKYGKTEALSYAKTLQQDSGLPDLNNRIIAINRIIQPSEKVLSQVPFYYKQLFSAKQTFHREFWVTMNKEVKIADMAFEQYNRLHEGALLITGEHHSGKSFFAYMLAHRWNESGKVVFINPPIGGSTEFQVFDEVIAEAFQVEKYDERLFESLPVGSFVVFEDIELWWQRTANGLIVLKHLLKLVSKFSNRIFFILNVNIYAFKLLEKILPLNADLLGVVKLSSMSVQSLKDMVLLRHNGTGKGFIYKNITSADLSAVKMADLFVKFYKFSRGNAGVTLAAWLSAIKKQENDMLWIEPLTVPNTDIIHQLSMDIKLILIQMLLHKQVTKQKLVIVSTLESERVATNLKFLWRMGLINKIRNEVYEINIYWYPIMVEYFTSKNFI